MRGLHASIYVTVFLEWPTKELRKRVLALNEQVANGGQGPSPSDRVREMDRQFDMLIQEEN